MIIQMNNRNLGKLRISGFTLLELMIVVAVIGILAAIAFPSYQNSVQKARRGDAQETLLECAAAQARYFTKSTPSSYMDGTGTTAGSRSARVEEVCGWNGTKYISQEGFYDLTIDVTDCGNAGGPYWCFVLTASAPTTSPQDKDTDCDEFTLDDKGNRTAVDTSDADKTDQCWRS